MPNRNVEGDYRYAFQGQEKDPETGKEAFELRLWDSRIGRWLTTDPYGQYSSPYLGMGNNPISMMDPDGGMACPDGDCGDFNGGTLDETIITGSGGGNRLQSEGFSILNASALLLTQAETFSIALPAIDTGGLIAAGTVAIPAAAIGGVLSPYIFFYGEPPAPSFSFEERQSDIFYPLTSAGQANLRPQLNPSELNDLGLLLSSAQLATLVHQMSKGGPRNVWPDGEYEKPNIPDIDWNLGDAELADQVTGPNPPEGKGPGSSWSKIKKWFRDVRRKLNNKRR